MWANITTIISADPWVFVLNAFLLICEGIAAGCVAAGIVWESAPSDSWKKRASHRLVIWGVVAEVVFSVCLFISDEIVSGSQLVTIRAQNEKIFALESHLVARTVTAEQGTHAVSLVSDALKPLRTEKIGYEFSAIDDEQFGLVIALSDNVFSKLGWEWVDWPQNLLGAFRTHLPTQNKWVGDVPLTGVQIQVSDPKLLGIADALVSALQSIGLENVRTAPELNAEFGNIDDKMMVAIMVGPRPPLRLSSIEETKPARRRYPKAPWSDSP